MSIQLTFFGAAGRVTGSLHLLEAAGARVALDAGLFQGPRAESSELNRTLPFDPRRLDAVVLSHAHIDHSGRLPLLVRHGFHGPIYATPATRDLCAVMLPDAAHIQEKDAEFLARRGKAGPQSEPLYTMRDALGVQDLMVGRAVSPHPVHPEESLLRVHRRGAHPRLRVGGRADHRGRQAAPPRVQRRHRAHRPAHHS